MLLTPAAFYMIHDDVSVGTLGSRNLQVEKEDSKCKYMSNVGRIFAAVVVAFVWLVVENLREVVSEFASSHLSSFSSLLTASSSFHSTLDCNVVSVGGVVVHRSESRTLERIAEVFERRIDIVETHRVSIDFLLFVLDHLQWIAGGCLLFAIIFLAVCCCRRSDGRRRSPARSPNPRPILCRGGGTLS